MHASPPDFHPEIGKGWRLKAVQQTGLLHFSNSQLPFYQYPYSSRTNVLRLYFTTHTWCYGLYQLQWCLDKAHMLTQNCAAKLKSSLQKIYRSYHKMVDRDEISNFFNDNGSFPFEIDLSSMTHKTFGSYRPSVWVIRRVSYKRQEQLTLLDDRGSPLVFLWSPCVSSI